MGARPRPSNNGWLSMGGAGVWALVGWVAGVALQLRQAELDALWQYAASAGLGVMLVLWGVVQHAGYRRCLAWGLAGLVLGWGVTGWRAVNFSQQSLPAALQRTDVEVIGRIATLPQRGPDGQRFVLAVESATIGSRAVQIPEKLQLAWYQRGAGVTAEHKRPSVRAGERWQLTVRLRQPHGAANPHGFDRERWWWEQGIGATGSVRSGAKHAQPRRLSEAPFYRVDRWREAVGERIAQRVSDERSAGVIAALVVGDQSAIERDDWDLFRVTGVAHLISISGLHVTLFAWIAVLGVGAGARQATRRWPAMALTLSVQQMAGVGGLALASAYAVFAGWGIPAQRTILMLALFVSLRLLGLKWPWPVVWGTALAVVLLLDPLAWLQAGFWLSFVAVGILFVALPTLQPKGPAGESKARRFLKTIGALLREQGVVTLALAPLTLLLFGQVSLIGLVANLLAIPWVTLVITPLALCGIVVPWLWDLAALAVEGLLVWLDWLAEWPFAAVYGAVPPLWAGVLAAIGALLLVMPLPWLIRSAGVLLIWPVWAWTPPRPPAGEFEVMALDVGQGSAVLVRTANHNMLFDTGPGYGPNSDAGASIVVPALRAMGEQINTVVVSHSDGDHSGGSEAVRAAWPHARWLSSFDALPSQVCLAGQRWDWDGVEFEMLHPSPNHFDEGGKGRLSSNAMSCTLRISNAREAAWLSGDLDADNETRLAMARPDLRARLLVSPHHGSKTSSSPVLLNTLLPEQVMVQSGYLNRFGHPAAQVIARYEARNMQWVSSPVCGAATWRSNNPSTMDCQRKIHRRYWHWGEQPLSKKEQAGSASE